MEIHGKDTRGVLDVTCPPCLALHTAWHCVECPSIQAIADRVGPEVRAAATKIEHKCAALPIGARPPDLTCCRELDAADPLTVEPDESDILMVSFVIPHTYCAVIIGKCAQHSRIV